jgi:hypothetical protein
VSERPLLAKRRPAAATLRRGRASQAGAEAITRPGRVASLLFIPRGADGWPARPLSQRKPELPA